MGYRIEKIRDRMPGPHLVVSELVLSFLNKMRGGDVQFIQIGANDGQFEDPLYAWICRHPWRGVLVEPQPQMYKKLVELHASRSARILIKQAVVADNRGKATLWTLDDVPGMPADASLFASLDRDVVLRNANNYLSDFEKLLVPNEVDAYTLDDLMHECGVDELDLLQIDTEGFDFKIIKTLDFTKSRPQVINYEHANLTPDDQRACRAYLAGLGYSFVSTYLGDTIACRDELLVLASASYGD
jgi:FkbM family methyltransferase